MNAERVYQLFKDYLENNRYRYTADDARLSISLTLQGEDLPQPTVISVLRDRNVVQIVSPIPGRIPEEKRIDAAVAVVIANYSVLNGCFDLDMNDGGICFRLVQGYHGIEFSEELAQYMLRIVFYTTDKYNDKFFMLGKGMMSLEKFIEAESQH